MGSFEIELFDALTAVGVSPERARAVVDGFERAIDGRYAFHSHVLATKRDLTEQEGRIVQRLGETFANRSDLAAFRSDFEERFAKVDVRFVKVDERFAQVDERFAQVDERFAQVDSRFARVESRLDRIEMRFDVVDERFRSLEHRIDARAADTKWELIRWMLAAMTAQTGVLVAALKLV